MIDDDKHPDGEPAADVEPLPPPPDEAAAWERAADGLDSVRKAVVLRVAIAIVAVFYVTVQFSSKHAGEGPGAFAMLLGLGELFPILWACAGAMRFGREAPDRTASSAGFAAILLGGCAIADVWVLWVTWKIMEAVSAASHATSMWNMPDLGSVMDNAEKLPYVQLVAACAGLIAILFILASIANVARAKHDPDLLSRAQSLKAGMMVFVLVYGGLQWWLAHGRHIDALMGLGALAVVGIFGLIVLFAYIGVLREAADSMRADNPAPLPTAELLS